MNINVLKRMRSQQELFLHECPLISEQFVNNSCSRKQFVSQKKSIRAPKNESRRDEPMHEHTWRGKRKERAEKIQQF